MRSQGSKKSGQTDVREDAHLDRQYHEIGISAVAAAVRYQREQKNPAYAPAISRVNEFYRYAAA
jgi:hypothetical protein